MTKMKDSFPENPYTLFGSWLSEAEKLKEDYPNAMWLATATKEGRPSVRVMLLKGWDENGFVFYTNAESRKGRELLENPYAALNFYWKTLKRQVRVEGRIEEVSEKESDDYFASRPRGSRIGAWASRQSRPVDNYETFRKRVEEIETKYDGQEDIPRPPYWKGFRVRPERIEFWHEGEFRLHHRYEYTPSGTGWNIQTLYP